MADRQYWPRCILCIPPPTPVQPPKPDQFCATYCIFMGLLCKCLLHCYSTPTRCLLEHTAVSANIQQMHGRRELFQANTEVSLQKREIFTVSRQHSCYRYGFTEQTLNTAKASSFLRFISETFQENR